MPRRTLGRSIGRPATIGDIPTASAELTDGVCLKSLPDTESLRGRPKAQVAVGLKKVEPTPLAGKKFSVPAAYDAEIDDHVASIYFVEHEDLDANEIEVATKGGDKFQVQWTGTTTDVDYDDGSKPRTRVEIVANASSRTSPSGPRPLSLTEGSSANQPLHLTAAA